MIHAYYAHLRYTLIHKWYVLIECWKRGLYWRGLIHDWQKFTPTEFTTYARYFFNPDGSRIPLPAHAATGEVADAYRKAWRHHWQRGDHHWQNWLNLNDWPRPLPPSKEFIPTPMSPAARLEMVCDWTGAGKAQGTGSAADWYTKNKERIWLHPDTRRWVEYYLRDNP